MVDGNYRAVRDLIWPRADTVVWLDYSLPLILARLTRRTFGRGLRRTELWNGNREQLWWHFLPWDKSLYFWAVKTHRRHRRDLPRRWPVPSTRTWPSTASNIHEPPRTGSRVESSRSAPVRVGGFLSREPATVRIASDCRERTSMVAERVPTDAELGFCPIARAARLLGDTWTLLIIYNLAEGPRRFSDLEKATGMSPRCWPGGCASWRGSRC